MPITRSPRASGKTKISRARHSELLKNTTQRHQPVSVPHPLAPVTVSSKEPLPSREWQGDKIVLHKNEHSLTVEQNLHFSPGPNQPIVNVRVRLTTALTGERQQNGLVEAAYLLRLEVLSASRAACVEGFSLGPWQLREQALEPGAVYIAEPLWAGFAPHAGLIRGRLLIHDQERHRLLDLPWQTEGILPGIEVLTA